MEPETGLQIRPPFTMQLNMPAFQQAFQCKAGDPMVRPEGQRCTLW
jgi:predicted metalloendopeptidase